MEQRLIVEGKDDAIAISSILRQRGVDKPLGYKDEDKYKNEFVKSSKGFTNISKVLEIEIQNSEVERIGVIIDANEVGAKSRLQSIANVLEKFGITNKEATQDAGHYYTSANGLHVSIWIMPNNKENGYLEHFLSELIPENHQDTWDYSSKAVDDYYHQNSDGLSQVKMQKSKVYAYLALMKNPGQSFGTAISAKYLDAKCAYLNPFENWFRRAFILEE